MNLLCSYTQGVSCQQIKYKKKMMKNVLRKSINANARADWEWHIGHLCSNTTLMHRIIQARVSQFHMISLSRDTSWESSILRSIPQVMGELGARCCMQQNKAWFSKMYHHCSSLIDHVDSSFKWKEERLPIFYQGLICLLHHSLIWPLVPRDQGQSRAMSLQCSSMNRMSPILYNNSGGSSNMFNF